MRVVVGALKLATITLGLALATIVGFIIASLLFPGHPQKFYILVACGGLIAAGVAKAYWPNDQ